jgi:prepilin peptidase CpaA
LAARRIPNRLVAALAVAGLCAAATVFREQVGVAGAPAGVAIGLAVWMPFWLTGAIGAGDVKLAAAIGAWLGPAGVLAASLLAAIAGGVLAAVVLVRRRRVRSFATALALWVGALQRGELARPLVDARADLLPYGVALGVAGVAIIEFALVAPLLLILVFGIIDLGRAYATLNQLAASTREGARFAAVLPNPESGPSQTQIRQTVKKFSERQLGGAALRDDQIFVSLDRPTATVTVEVRGYSFQLVTPLAGVVGLRTVPINRRATFRWERGTIP